MSPFETEVTTGVYKSAFESAGSLAFNRIFIPSWHDNQLFIEAWQERIAVLEVPIGFTCDHMETLYDIDIVHREHAIKAESCNIH
jgi:protoheme ferro-lyase